ncbi:MAG: ferrous iron transporter B, partial [Clostridia bacterium]|nr:ferrous iron transporter B [Clostridia bacterium]
MGLTKGSTGVGVLDTEFLSKRKETDKIIALAGNPNVGKSTVFNGLTGMNQHTGNWPGKTVATAQGYYKGKNNSFLLVDIPGTYSLSAHSAEEECARDFICFKNPDGVVVVCDGVSLERNLNLVLQIMETGQKTAVCVNLLDEAKRKGIEVNTAELSKILGVPVVGAAARNRRTLAPLKAALDEFDNSQNRFRIEYPAEIEMALALIESSIKPVVKNRLDCRWLSLKILSGDNAIIKGAEEYLGIALHNNEEIKNSIEAAFDGLLKMGLDLEKVGDIITSTVVKTAQEISRKTVKYGIERKGDSDRRIDRVLTGKYTA